MGFRSGLLAALLAGGCAVGPDYQRPAPVAAAATPAAFSDGSPGGVQWKRAEPAAGEARGEWWRMFGDDELNRLEPQALRQNQDLAAAAARFAQARDLAVGARAGFYPTLTAGGTPNGDLSRARTSVNAPQAGHRAGSTYTYSEFTAPLYLGWELDLWGRVRRVSQGARARYAAAADDLESARLAVTAEVAADYFTWRALDAEHRLIADTVETYRRSLQLTVDRRRGGAVSDLDVAQAGTQLHTAEAQLPAIELARTQVRNALALLCGRAPGDFTLAGGGEFPAVPEVPSIVPAALLEHRPDIAGMERRMAAANADVGVARAAFYPTVKLDGLAGFQSVGFDSWFNWPSRFWSVGPSVTVPLFTGGLNRAKLAAARDTYDETVAEYRQTVLNAFVEVENGLAAQRLLGEQWRAENAALTTSRQALAIADHRYRAGLVTYLDVATAQTDALAHERTVLQLSGQRLAATVNLVKALGGGWEPAEVPRAELGRLGK